MFVEPVEGVFRIKLVELLAKAGCSYDIDVNASSGDVTSSNVYDTVEGYYEVPVKGLIDGAKAYQVALDAIAGYEHYDKQGRFTVQLQGEDYVITFPLISEGGDSARGADYAYQVSVDGRTGAVGSILAAS